MLCGRDTVNLAVRAAMVSKIAQRICGIPIPIGIYSLMKPRRSPDESDPTSSIGQRRITMPFNLLHAFVFFAACVLMPLLIMMILHDRGLLV